MRPSFSSILGSLLAIAAAAEAVDAPPRPSRPPRPARRQAPIDGSPVIDTTPEGKRARRRRLARTGGQE
ncbi:hypothetical protein [Mesorhizobium sp. CAU 1741]|uniref:hypothetical protein n=1 Tax=Mesorhizobium sp. CAU 1741 TaxID=3140366 RepID=UPI00325BA620